MLGQLGSGNYKAPWIERPYQLVTWMDILKFHAHRFYITANLLVALSETMKHRLTDKQRKDSIDADVQKNIREIVTHIRDECKAINLALSLVSAEALLARVEERSTWELIHEKFEELNGRIRGRD